MNAEVRNTGPRPTIVRDQVFALTTITNRLKLAFNGQDVDWIDTGNFLSAINSVLTILFVCIIDNDHSSQTKRGMGPVAVRATVRSPTMRTALRKVLVTRDHVWNQSRNHRSSHHRRSSTRSRRRREWTSSHTRVRVRAVRVQVPTRPSP